MPRMRSMWLNMTCVWQSNSPGSRTRSERSTDSSPSRPVPTSAIRPFSITTSATDREPERGSNTRAPASRVLMIVLLLRQGAAGVIPVRGSDTRREGVAGVAPPGGPVSDDHTFGTAATGPRAR